MSIISIKAITISNLIKINKNILNKKFNLEYFYINTRKLI